MAETTAKDRVYAAAEKVSAERTPTVSAVRELASVSNADATRYLKEWKEDRAAAAGRMAAAPPSVTEIAVRMAGAAWTEAAALADARHAEVEAAWREERIHKDRELQELALELDGITAARAKDQETASGQIASLTKELGEQTTTLTGLQTELVSVRESATALSTELAKANATIDTLRATQAAILARISPEDPRQNQGGPPAAS